MDTRRDHDYCRLQFPVSYEQHTVGEVAFPLFMDGDLAKLYLAH
jgi:hypothetical protein